MIRPREFKTQNLPVYKIGKTSKENFERFKSYGKGYEVVFLMICDNCTKTENVIKHQFKRKFTQKLEYGYEYFEGNIHLMKERFASIVLNCDKYAPSETDAKVRHCSTQTVSQSGNVSKEIQCDFVDESCGNTFVMDDWIQWFESNYVKTDHDTDCIHINMLWNEFQKLTQFYKYNRAIKKMFTCSYLRDFICRHPIYSLCYRERYRNKQFDKRNVLCYYKPIC
jgi:hypothetical protein